MEVKNKKKISLLVAVIVIIALALLVVRYQIVVKPPMKIIYVSKTADESDFWSMMIEGASMAAKEKGAQLKVVAPNKEEDIEKQNMLIEEAIAEKPDAIVLTPSDYVKTLPAAEKIKASGIKLVLVDSTLNKEVADAVITTDNIEAGRAMGNYVRENSDENVRIGIVSHVKGASTAIDRESGFREGLQEKSTNVMDTVFSDSSYERAYEVTKKMLERRPDITMVAGLNEYSTVGAGRAIEELGISDKVKIVGFDNSIEEIQMLESGVVSSIVIQKPFDMGYLGVKTAIDLVNGEKTDRSINSGSKLILKETIYTSENQKLLFPFYEKNARVIKK